MKNCPHLLRLQVHSYGFAKNGICHRHFLVTTPRLTVFIYNFGFVNFEYILTRRVSCRLNFFVGCFKHSFTKKLFDTELAYFAVPQKVLQRSHGGVSF